MFDLLRKNRAPHQDSPRQVARERVQSAIRRDRSAVRTGQLSQLRADLLNVINGHLPVDGDFTEFDLYRDGDDVFLVSRVRLRPRR